MLAKKRTTYIILERGVEDVALLKELEQIRRDSEMGSYNFGQKFRLVTMLRQYLQREVEEE